MTARAHEIIDNMSDVEVVRFLEHFGREAFAGLKRESVLEGVSLEVKDLQEYQDLEALDGATRESRFGPADSAVVARAILDQLADDDQIAELIAKASGEYKPDKLFVEAILPIGAAASMVLFMASAIEVEYKGLKVKKEAVSAESVKAVAEAMFNAITRLGGA